MELPPSQPIFNGSSEFTPPAEGTEFNYRFDILTIENLQKLAEDTLAKCDALFYHLVESEELTYDNIGTPLNEIDDILAGAYSFLSTVSMLHADPAIRREASRTSLSIQRDSSFYMYSFDANKKVRAYQETDEAKRLKGEQKRYLECSIMWMDEAGYGLPRSNRQKIKKLNTALYEFEDEFIQNISEGTTRLSLNEEEVAGLDAQDRGAFLVDLGNGQYELELVESTYTGFVSSASDRDARRRAYVAFNSRAKETNTRLLQKAVNVRQKTAGMLGYESWMELNKKYNMAKSPKEIEQLYDSIVPALTAKAQQELATMEELLIADGHSGPLQVYDLEYYEKKLFKEKYNIDPGKICEYLPLPAVLAATFDLTGKLFGLNIREQETQTWHPDVMSFAVDNAQTNEYIGTIYMDLFPREGKYKHCCCHPQVGGRAMPDGTYRQPSSLIIANITPPVAGESALLSQTERVDVAFHEFGHALHDVLTKAKLSVFAGLATEIDFIEIPSQIMENWAWNKEILQKYARHYKTGEPMPSNMIDALIDSRDLNVGIKYLQHVSKGLFDVSLHNSLDPVDVTQCWEQALEISPFPKVDESFYPATFDHLMSSYAGSYYSYIYDEIFSSDMFRRFQEEGLLNPETGKDYRQTILEPGASKSGVEMVKNFLGRKVDGEFFLRSLGVIAPAEL